MKVSVTFAWIAETRQNHCSSLSHAYYDRWKGLEQGFKIMMYRFQNDDELT